MVSGLVTCFWSQITETCLNLGSVIRKTINSQSKKFRGRSGHNFSFLSVSSFLRSQCQLVLRLCSWFQNGLCVGPMLPGSFSVGERGRKKCQREKERERERQQERESGRERNIDVREKHWPFASQVCPDLGSNPKPLVGGTMLQPTDPPCQGREISWEFTWAKMGNCWGASYQML